jgi:hypothetical protein
MALNENEMKIEDIPFDFEVFDINVSPLDLVVVSDNRIALSYCFGVRLYDDKFRFVISIIDPKLNYQPHSLAFDPRKNALYVSELSLHKILIYKFDRPDVIFHLADFTFNSPTGLAYHNKILYVCDTMNKSIKTISIHNFDTYELLSDLKVKYHPLAIKATDDIICVQPNGVGIYFYSLNKSIPQLPEIAEFYNGCSTISIATEVVNPFIEYKGIRFYEMSHVYKKVFCYDTSGKLLSDFSLKPIEKYLKEDEFRIDNNENSHAFSSRDGIFVTNWNGFFLTGHYKMKIIQFSFSKVLPSKNKSSPLKKTHQQ